MFRYVALAWDPRAAPAAALAQAMAAALRAFPAWRQDLVRPGLGVFTSGAAAGINQAYPLRGGRGVVLGRLFPRSNPEAPSERVVDQVASTDAIAATAGRALLDNYWGRYIAFFEAGSGAIQVLRDPSGGLPCYGLRHGGVTVVFSWLEDVLVFLPQVPAPSVSREGLAAYMAFGELTGRRCALDGVTRILAGERVSLGDIDKPVVDLQWDASRLAETPSTLRPAQAAEALRDTVTTCVQAWAACYDSILLRLSGGVDSSILASCLGQGRTPAKVTCLNYHSPGSDSDERSFARLAADAAKLELIEYERDAAFNLERILDVARTPVPNHYVGRLTSSSDIEIANVVGASAMFSGAGGDQLFYEFPYWWPAADYLRLRGIGPGFFGAALDAGRLGGVSVWAAMRLALVDRFRRVPPAQDLFRHRELISEDVWDQAERAKGFVHPVFLSRTSLPIGKLSQVQQLAYPGGYYDPFGRERAPEHVDPLLSQPIMELCLSLPTFVLAQGGRGRALARDAFKGRVPDAIVNRRAKGGMGEHFEKVLAANRAFARDVLLDGELVRLGLLDRVAVQKALSTQGTARGASAGEIHIAIGVEAWARRWSQGSRRAS